MQPKSQRRLAWAGVLLSILYLFNFGAGIFEIIPDIVPVIGNLDEAGAALLLFQSLRTLRGKSQGANGAVPRLRPPEPPG